MTSRPLPEWAPHQAVWIGFPSDPALWLADLKAAEREVAAFAAAVHAGGTGEQVRLVAAHEDAAGAARRASASTAGAATIRSTGTRTSMRGWHGPPA